jgi:hypothetical protein
MAGGTEMYTNDSESNYFDTLVTECSACKVLEELRENNAKRREVCAMLEERNRCLEERVKDLEGKLSRAVRKLSFMNGKYGDNSFGRE